MRRKNALQRNIKNFSLIISILLIATSCYAINIFEILAYKKDVIKTCNATVLVNPLTGEIKYLWYDTLPGHTNGHWEPVSGTIKGQFQAMYDNEHRK